MEKLKSLLTSKKFWTLVTAIVAALAAYFAVGCATTTSLTIRGAQIDSLNFDRTMEFRSRK